MKLNDFLAFDVSIYRKRRLFTKVRHNDSSGFYICESIVNDVRHGNLCVYAGTVWLQKAMSKSHSSNENPPTELMRMPSFPGMNILTQLMGILPLN